MPEKVIGNDAGRQSRFRWGLLIGSLVASVPIVSFMVLALLSREKHMAYLAFLLVFPGVKALSFLNEYADRLFPILMFVQLGAYGGVFAYRWKHWLLVCGLLITLHCLLAALCFWVEWQYVRECLYKLPYLRAE